MNRVRDAVLRWLRGLSEQARLVVVVAGAGATVAGSLAPWATFPGFPGKMTLAGYPGGARVYSLILAVAALLIALAPGLRARRAAGIGAAAGALAVSAGNVVAIANQGGQVTDVAWGAWLATVGALACVAGFAGRPDEQVPAWPRTPLALDVVGTCIAGVLVLWGVVIGLEIEESSRFLSFLAFTAAAAAIAWGLGAVAWLQRVSDEHRAVVAIVGLAAAAAFPFTQGGSGYWVRVFASIGVFAAAALGLNVVVGLAGLLDLGYIAFFGVGAYTGALLGGAALSTVDIHLPFLLVILLAACISAIAGVIIGAPTLRLRGDYLAIVTLGFGEIFRIAVNNWDALTRGPNGIAGIPDLAILGFNFGETHEVAGIDLAGFANYYFAEILLLICAVVVFTRLNESRVGRAWVAIREDEVAAAAMGINTVRLKLLAFAIGAFLAGAAGSLNAHVTSQVSPDSYTFLESILLLAAVVLGGMGTVPGALLGSAALFVIPEKLRAFQDKRLLLFGIALILLMRFRPTGIVASQRRKREFEDGSEADAMSAPPGAPVTTERPR